MVTRRRGESQRDCVRRLLVERGVLTAREALYEMRYPDGRATAITRLGARIYELRREGFVIDTRGPGLARYVVRQSPCRVDGDVAHDRRGAHRGAAGAR